MNDWYYDEGVFIQEVKEHLDLIYVGEIIGSGMNTVVIDPYEEWVGKTSINNPVLIITREPDKRKMLNAIFEGTSAKTQKIKLNSVSSEISDIIEYLKDVGYDVFLSTKLESEMLNSESKTIKILSEITGNLWSNEYSKFNLNSLINEFENFLNYQEIKELNLEIINAVKSSLNNLLKADLRYGFKLDLHEGQFCRTYNGELICIDPIYTEM